MKSHVQENGHTKRGNIIFQVLQINKQIDLFNYQLAQKMINELWDDYSNDYGLLKSQARLYLLHNRIDDALEIYNQMDEIYVYTKKAFIYFIKDDAAQLKRIYDTYYYYPQIKLRDLSYEKEVKYQLLGYFKLPIDHPFVNLRYELRQRYDYSLERAIEHVIRRHELKDENLSDDEINCKKNGDKFREDIDIKSLFYEVLEIIKNNKDNGMFVKGTMQYIIKYPNIGYDLNGKILDHIKVVVIPGTFNILSMYPSNVKYISRFVIKKEKEENIKVRKIKSPMEKFKEKYNM